MHNRTRFIWVVLFGLILLVDPLTYSLLGNMLQATGTGLYALLYWMLPVVLLVWFFILMRFYSFYVRNPAVQNKYFHFFGILILFYIPKFFYMIPALLEWLINQAIDKISLYEMEIHIISQISGVLVATLFLLILYGMVYGRFHFKKEQVILRHEELPEGFDGFRIVQISDIH